MQPGNLCNLCSQEPSSVRALKEECYEIGWPSKDEILWIFSAFHEKRGQSSYWLFFTVLEGSMLATGGKKQSSVIPSYECCEFQS